MKNLIRLSLVIALIACQPDDAVPVQPVDDNFDTSKAKLLKQGTLVGVGHTASGTASVYDSNGTTVVILDPYSSQNGPDLKVYLSKDDKASDYIKLGNLKSTMGKQVYGVPSGVDITQFGFVHIWCEKYTVVFAIAEVR